MSLWYKPCDRRPICYVPRSHSLTLECWCHWNVAFQAHKDSRHLGALCNCPSLRGSRQHAHGSTEKVEQHAFCYSVSTQQNWGNTLPRSILLSPIAAEVQANERCTIENAGALSQTNLYLTDQLCSSVCSLCCRINVWVVLSHGDTVSCWRH